MLQRAARGEWPFGAHSPRLAAQLEIGEKTLRRHLKAPSGDLARLVEESRTEQAKGAADELTPLRGKALAVLEKALDAGDLGAAKALLGKLVAGPADAPPQETAPEPEVPLEDALREVAAALDSLPDLFRAGAASLELVELVREAARGLLADDLRPRAPVDAEAERVDPGAVAPPAGEARPVPPPELPN